MKQRSRDLVFAVRCIASFALVTLISALIRLVLKALPADSNPLQSRDRTILQNLREYSASHPLFVTVMRGISETGAVMWWVIFTPICLWLIWPHRSRLAVFIAVTALGSSLLNRVIKVIIGRARPYLSEPIATATGNSFPSGHVQAAVVGSALLVILIGSKSTPTRIRDVSLAIGVTTAIGFSRMALGVHYLSDVIGAVVVGLIWVLLTRAAYRAWMADVDPTHAQASRRFS